MKLPKGFTTEGTQTFHDLSTYHDLTNYLQMVEEALVRVSADPSRLRIERDILNNRRRELRISIVGRYNGSTDDGVKEFYLQSIKNINELIAELETIRDRYVTKIEKLIEEE